MEVAESYDLAVVGGGPAGTAAAITAARLGARALLLERGSFPRHKVCGEFVSPEAVGLLLDLTADDREAAQIIAQAPRLYAVRLHTAGRTIETPLRPPGVSIERYALDHMLWRAAQGAGVECRDKTTVIGVQRCDAGFAVASGAERWLARHVVNASGRWSELSHKPPAAGERWLGIKAHYASRAEDLCVDLYFFDEGYCGVQPVSNDRLNVCALVRADGLRNIGDVLRQHAGLRTRSHDWRPEMRPLTTFPIVFRPVLPVRGDVLNVGDAAAFIDPFLGDGISMALHSGTLAGEIAAAQDDIHASVREYQGAYYARYAPAHRLAAMARAALTSSWRELAIAAMRIGPLAAVVLGGTRARGR